jgi:hypothetical protein
MNLKLAELDRDMDKYSFDIEELSAETREHIKHLYTILYKIYNNKIFIENISNANIRITDKIMINNKLLDTDAVNDKTTLFFVNCNNNTIQLNTKTCHVTFDNCSNINFKTRHDIITGLDIMRSKHIYYTIENACLYFVALSKCEDCTFWIDEQNALDTMITSYDTFGIKINLICPIDHSVKLKYEQILSFFDIYRIYSFNKQNDKIELINKSYNSHI